MGQDKHRILVVGCGLAGATVARELADRGYNIDIIDARSHVAGNAYDYQDERGFRIHKYGPHLYHTNDAHVHEWLLNLQTGLTIGMKSKQFWEAENI